MITDEDNLFEEITLNAFAVVDCHETLMSREEVIAPSGRFGGSDCIIFMISCTDKRINEFHNDYERAPPCALL